MKHMKPIGGLLRIVFLGLLLSGQLMPVAAQELPDHPDTPNTVTTPNETASDQPAAAATPNSAAPANEIVIAQPIAPTPDIIITIPTKNTAPTQNIISTENKITTPTYTIVRIPEPVLYPPKYYYDSPSYESFLYPRRREGHYPDINLDGQFELKYSFRDFNPKPSTLSPTDNRFEVIRNDPAYTKLPQDVLVGDPQFNMRYRFNIDGKLNEDLSVHYDVEQEPDFPGKYDIQIQYKRSKLTFWHFDSSFQNGEFINVDKALDGAKFESSTDQWEAIVATGRQRSEPKKYISYGDNKTKFNVGNTNLLEGSVKVWVNNSRKSEGSDYQINYYEGSITFKTPLGPADVIEVVYEFTNPIEDFIPVLSRKNFMGAQFKYRSEALTEEIKTSKPALDKFVYITPSENSTINQQFDLKHYPVVLGSVIVRLNGKPLKPNIDYYLKASNGKLKLLERELVPRDELSISYDYYLTKRTEEYIIAKDSPGPYKLKNNTVIENTAIVYVDHELKTEGHDYNIDTNKGTILFNYPIKYPTPIDVTYTAIQTTLKQGSVEEAPMEFGITYMNESVKSNDEELQLKVTSESVTVTASKLIYTKNTPLINTANFQLVVDNQVATSADFRIKNAYTGQIEILNNTFINKTAVLNYDYQKSFSTKYIFRGTADRAGNGLYENNLDPMYLQDIPVRYDSIEEIRIWNGIEEKRLEAGKEFDVIYSNNGTDLQIQFTKRSDRSSSFLEQYPGQNDTITLIYDYTPESSPDAGSISQTMIGLTFGKKLNDHWKINTEIAAAQNNFEKPQLDQTVVLTGTGQDNASYQIGNYKNLVEDSEAVFIRRKDSLIATNNRTFATRLTKEKDYYVNYQNGSIRFINLTPSTSDEIIIDFKYLDTAQTVTAGEQKDYKLATKLETQFENKEFTVKGDFKNIDKEFIPIGQMKEQKGSKVIGGSVEWRPRTEDKLFMDYHQRSQLQSGKTDNSEDIFLNIYDLQTQANLKVINDIFDTENSFRYLLEVQEDKITSTNLHDVDNLTLDYKGKVSFGPSNFRVNTGGGFSSKVGDYLDDINRTEQINQNRNIGIDMYFPKVFLLGDTTLNPSYVDAKTQTKAKVQVGSENVTQMSSTLSDTWGTKAKVVPFRNLVTDGYYYQSQQTQTFATTSTRNISQAKNSEYNVYYTPFTWIDMRYRNKRDESISPLTEQQGSLTTEENYTVPRFSPFGAVTDFGIDKKHYLIQPFTYTNVTYGQSRKNQFENDRRRKTFYESENYAISNINPYKGITIKTISFDGNSNNMINNVTSTTSSKNVSSSDYNRNVLEYSINLPYKYIDKLTFNSYHDAIRNTRISETFANTTNNRTTYSEPFNKDVLTYTYKPGKIKWHLFNLGDVNFNFTDLLEKKKNDQIDSVFAVPDKSVRATADRLSRENSFIHTQTTQVTLKPYDYLNVNSSFIRNDIELSRNKVDSNKGLTLKESEDFKINGDFNPLRFMKVDLGYTQYLENQLRSPSLNASQQAIEDAKAINDAATFKDSLFQRDQNYNAKVTFFPFKFLDVSAGGTYKKLQQEIITASPPDNTSPTIFRKAGLVGVVLKPIVGLRIGYEYQIKSISQELNGKNTISGRGYGGTTTLEYTPIKRKGFEVNILGSMVDTWGKDLNSLESLSVLQGTGDTIQQNIVDRKDRVINASIQVNCDFPFPNSPYLDKFTLTIEGYFKAIIDEKDKQRKLSAEQQRSYDVSGLIMKGTLHF